MVFANDSVLYIPFSRSDPDYMANTADWATVSVLVSPYCLWWTTVREKVIQSPAYCQSTPVMDHTLCYFRWLSDFRYFWRKYICVYGRSADINDADIQNCKAPVTKSLTWYTRPGRVIHTQGRQRDIKEKIWNVKRGRGGWWRAPKQEAC